MITKEQFVNIINKMKATDDFVRDVNDKARQLRELIDPDFTDFFDGNSLIITHTDVVVQLLENMFNDKDYISWWIYELDYGRTYEEGDIKDEEGNSIDLSTAEKLYDFLIEESCLKNV